MFKINLSKVYNDKEALQLGKMTVAATMVELYYDMLDNIEEQLIEKILSFNIFDENDIKIMTDAIDRIIMDHPQQLNRTMLDIEIDKQVNIISAYSTDIFFKAFNRKDVD